MINEASNDKHVEVKGNSCVYYDGSSHPLLSQIHNFHPPLYHAWLFVIIIVVSVEVPGR